jgi:hypothetical protein
VRVKGALSGTKGDGSDGPGLAPAIETEESNMHCDLMIRGVVNKRQRTREEDKEHHNIFYTEPVFYDKFHMAIRTHKEKAGEAPAVELNPWKGHLCNVGMR